MGRDHLGDIDIDGSTIFKFILEKSHVKGRTGLK